MGESFYTVLQIDRDADVDAIEAAYREHVKTHHPDVSDAPDASEQFKRLTVARDTLADAETRDRYDSLGHDAYVRRHSPPGFDCTTDTTDGPAADSDGQPTASTADDATWETWWETRETEPKVGASTASANVSPSGGGIYGGQGRRVRTESASRASKTGLLGRAVGLLQSLGAWVVLYLVLFGSVAITGWFMFSTGSHASLSAPTLGFVVLLAVGSMAASVVHLLSVVYT